MHSKENQIKAKRPSKRFKEAIFMRIYIIFLVTAIRFWLCASDTANVLSEIVRAVEHSIHVTFVFTIEKKYVAMQNQTQTGISMSVGKKCDAREGIHS